ncbi:MAG: hypothetical protein KBA28_09710 [Syntrophaceae bacterium]|jgi:hypothetical protein|nr:hypothetical protein [Syntrophaceae bacterium]
MGKQLETETNGKELNQKMLRVIPFMVAAKDVESGCRSAGISTTCFYDWFRNCPAFSEELERQRGQVITDAMTRLKQGITSAVDRLIELVGSENEEVSRKASTSIVEMALKLREDEELTQRIESIEKIVLERRIYR